MHNHTRSYMHAECKPMMLKEAGVCVCVCVCVCVWYHSNVTSCDINTEQSWRIADTADWTEQNKSRAKRMYNTN